MKTFTTRWHGSTGAAVLAGVSLTGIGIKDTAKLQFRQANHFCEAAALVLQGQLIVVEDHWVQAALEAAQHLRGPLVSQAADVIHLDLGAKVDGAVCAERLEVQRGFAALHVAVVQGQAREVAVQLQEHRMPASIINGPARNSQDSRATSAVQLEPEFAIDNLQEENRNQSASGAQLSHNTSRQCLHTVKAALLHDTKTAKSCAFIMNEKKKIRWKISAYFEFAQSQLLQEN